MVEPGKERDGGTLDTKDHRPEPTRQKSRAKTEGTDRDFDESGESRNQGHGHPREERGRES